MRFILSFVIAMLSSVAALAQYDISGLTFSKKTRLPVDSVCVVLMKDYVAIDTTYSYMTNVYGRRRACFDFEDVKLDKGLYILRFTHPKFQDAEMVLDLSKHKSKQIDLDFTYLSPKPKDISLSGATVRATQRPATMSSPATP